MRVEEIIEVINDLSERVELQEKIIENQQILIDNLKEIVATKEKMLDISIKKCQILEGMLNRR